MQLGILLTVCQMLDKGVQGQSILELIFHGNFIVAFLTNRLILYLSREKFGCWALTDRARFFIIFK